MTAHKVQMTWKRRHVRIRETWISLAVAAELRRMLAEGLVSVEMVDGVETWKLTDTGKKGIWKR